MNWEISVAVLLAGVLIAASIAFMGRYQITATGSDPAHVYRLDRWSGDIEQCSVDTAKVSKEGIWVLRCDVDFNKVLYNQ